MVLNGVVRSISSLRTVLQSLLFVPFLYTVLFNMIPTFLVAWENATRLQERFNDNFRGRANTYDFIVVGGGTAGSVVANRLSELYSVLLIEAGGPANPLTLIPALTLNLRNRPQTDWRFKTVPQSRACLNSINQECLISAGRALGGSSTLDSLAFLRGHSADFDTWARIDRNWSYEQVLPFFRRSEEFIGTSTDASARGRDGELRVREPDFVGLGAEWTRAGIEMGYPTVDFNGQRGQGFSILQYPLRRGMRQSSDSAFILPIRLSPRLRVLSNTVVNRILFRDMTNMAYGVEFERFGRTEIAVARREVIISAGALGSPKLLLLSGVGPRAELQQMGIPLRSDVPVGRNLQDHLVVPVGPFFFTPPSQSSATSSSPPRSFLQDRDFTPESIVNWITTGRGPLSSTGLQGVGAISSIPARARGESAWPDILLLLHGQGIYSTFPRTFSQAHSLQEDEISRFYAGSEGRDAFHINVVGARPTSRGSLTLASTNPRNPPIVNPGYLSDAGQADVMILTEGIMAALNLVENTTTFRVGGLGASLGPNLLPGCESHRLRTMAYWTCYIQRFSHSWSNPVGTAAMGSVVDGDLKVRGTRGLRVIDASIMPSIVSTGTLATTLMIGERGVDFILREHAANSSTTSASLTGVLTSAVFGRNGLLLRNPVQRFLAQEFDRMNPLPSLFRMPINSTADFNPFSRFLGLFRLPGTSPQQNAGGSGIFDSIFSTFNQQTTSLLSTLMSLGGSAAAMRARPPVVTATTPTPTPRPTRPLFPLGNILQQLGGGGGRQNPLSGRNATSTTNNNLFDIIFPVRNSTITLLNPFQDIYRNQQQQQMNNNNNFNIFGDLFQPRPTPPPQRQQPPLGLSTPIIMPPRPQNNNTNASFPQVSGGNFLQNLNPFSIFQLPTPPPLRGFSSISPLTSSSAPVPVSTTSVSSSQPPFRIILRTTTSTVIPSTSTSETFPTPSTPSTTASPITEPPELPLLSEVSGNISTSFTVPIVEETTTTTSTSTSESTTEIEEAEPVPDPTTTTQIPITTSLIDPIIEEVNNNDVDIDVTNSTTLSDQNQSSIDVGTSNDGGSPDDTNNLRAIRLISEEAEKFRKVHEDFHPHNKNPSDLIHYNDNDFSPALSPANFQVEHEKVPFYDYEEVVKYANNKKLSRGSGVRDPYQNIDYDDDDGGGEEEQQFPVISYQTTE